MENRNVGWLIIGISVVMAILVWIFNNALKKIVGDTCTHGPTCTMFDTISIQTGISLAITVIILIIGLVIMFTKPKEKIIVKKVKEKKRKLNLESLDSDERKAVNLLLKDGKAMFQSHFMEKLGIGKVKATRLLDKLEAKQMIERKRKGMNNIIVLKD